MVSEIGKTHSQAGALQTEMDHIEERISSNISLRRHLDMKLRDIVSQIYKNEKSKQHVRADAERPERTRGVCRETEDQKDTSFGKISARVD